MRKGPSAGTQLPHACESTRRARELPVVRAGVLKGTRRVLKGVLACESTRAHASCLSFVVILSRAIAFSIATSASVATCMPAAGPTRACTCVCTCLCV